MPISRLAEPKNRVQTFAWDGQTVGVHRSQLVRPDPCGKGAARHKHLNVSLAADNVTPLAVVGGLVLWLLRLSLAPTSTLSSQRTPTADATAKPSPPAKHE
jgi:hypothetical protein